MAAARSRASVCLVTPAHLASNPRLVKEADALHAAGYRTHVVAADLAESLRAMDQTILARARVDLHARGSRHAAGLRVADPAATILAMAVGKGVVPMGRRLARAGRAPPPDEPAGQGGGGHPGGYFTRLTTSARCRRRR